MNKQILSWALMAWWGCSTPQQMFAQQKVGDFIESKSNNEAKRGADRHLQYTPEGNAWVCVNGKNRYTRGLYGGYTDYRLETSDMPIFAVFKKGHHRNVRFVVNGVLIDSAAYCKAAYADASRSYLLRDGRLKDALEVEAQALRHEEGAIFRFAFSQGQERLQVKTMVCEIANKKIRRNGDMGADPAGVFEPSPTQEGLVVSDAIYNSQRTVAYVYIHLNEARPLPFDEADALWQSTKTENRQLAERVQFQTPDPYINTLGGALVTAADGDWDGQTWLHGCIGWRMPLAGWRAAYLGDVLGWKDRARSHFDAYAKSQVTEVEPTIAHPSNDPKMKLARAEKKWGTQMYSNGYICRNPERNDQMHHYDMNLNYMDELLWHFCYDADTAYMRKMWPVIKRHLAWEKRNFDPDGDHLYDGYCCIWASDALYYSGGAVTHSSAYNYRGNLLAARIADIIGEDATPYQAEAEAISQAMNQRLWMQDEGHWAEYQDLMGLKRLHGSAALWSVYTPIDCGLGTPEQCYHATRYVDREIPHIAVTTADGRNYGHTIATSNWLPYSWSINNVAAAEVMHTALAYFEAGRPEAGYRLMMANIMDQMYLGDSPANFGQISFYDAARGECYRDFGDCIGISSRTLIQGLFGIVPDALNGRLMIRPGFPASWDSVRVTTPYLSYSFKRVGGKEIFEVKQQMAQPLQIIIRQNLGGGRYRDIAGNSHAEQTITTDAVNPLALREPPFSSDAAGNVTASLSETSPNVLPETIGKQTPLALDAYFNASVDDIFKNEYLSPRPPYTTLQIPTQGIGEWCHPTLTADINDSVFRSTIRKGMVDIGQLRFRSPAAGKNIIYTSLFDNYPDSITIPLKGKASGVCLLMAGSTNHMQCHIDNGLVVVQYQDNMTDTLSLTTPDTWCPIEQDYYVDQLAFRMKEPRPLRVCFGATDKKVTDKKVPLSGRNLGDELGITEVYGRPLPGGAGVVLNMPLNPKKKLKCLTLRTLSNDVVIGIMGATLYNL